MLNLSYEYELSATKIQIEQIEYILEVCCSVGSMVGAGVSLLV